jgi:hypothetical protein
MSSGTASAKQPKLRPPPKLTPAPAPTTTAETLDRLGKLDEWTEEPARRAAAALEGKGEETPQPAAENAPEAQETAKPEYPWQQPGMEGTHLANFKLERRLFLKLKYLGETTYGSNMTKILSEALEPKVNKMLKERGIKP